ncbi:SDR family NAD(P)-dependent oxidoreductase [Nonomuraea aridisoli]|uniref:SDR family NAD(P)-dependent oxidoreductase n=1 Tax=Nonomuraea aridisoli TaxID=2070368 RepID=A0A2W2D4Y4_9ACTN|nr:SDR family NAD(P)-dependent oxidoreductase [Nonomuraea aridisoli]PZG06976.1 hypothetical protein C1J01_41845 [Nonomuraea aridisoli]
MTHKQHPIGTGFTAASTAADVLAGIDLTGTNVVVTGGHAGLGLETTRALGAAGASVTVGSRDPDRAAVALAGIERVEVSRLDLLDPASIDAFAGAMGLIDASGRPIIAPERGLKTPQQGAATIVFAATSPLLAGIGGVYLKDSDISPLDEDPRPVVFGVDQDVPADIVPHAIDPRSAQRLWELSEQLIKA